MTAIAFLKTAQTLRATVLSKIFQCGLWYGGSSIIMPTRSFTGISLFPKSLDESQNDAKIIAT